MARGEVTGRKPLVSPPLAFSIAEFCLWHSLSQSMFFKLQTQGLAPRTMQVGRRRLISAEEAARWRAEREQAAQC